MKMHRRKSCGWCAKCVFLIFGIILSLCRTVCGQWPKANEDDDPGNYAFLSVFHVWPCELFVCIIFDRMLSSPFGETHRRQILLQYIKFFYPKSYLRIEPF